MFTLNLTIHKTAMMPCVQALLMSLHFEKKSNAACAPPWLFTLGATLLHNSPYKINSHMLSHGKSNNLLLQKKKCMGYLLTEMPITFMYG